MQIETFSGNHHLPPVQISMASRKLMSVFSLLLFEGSAAEVHTFQSSRAEPRPLKHNSTLHLIHFSSAKERNPVFGFGIWE